jgi:hypothetical protein
MLLGLRCTFISFPGAWNRLQEKDHPNVGGGSGSPEQRAPGNESVAATRRRDSSLRDSFGFRASIDESDPALAARSQRQNSVGGSTLLRGVEEEDVDVREKRAALRAKRR